MSSMSVPSIAATLPEDLMTTQVAHGLGVVGALIPVKSDVTPGQYVAAGYTSDTDVADFIALVIDADTFRLLPHGFHNVGAHGYTANVYYSGHPTGFVAADTLTNADYIQNAFKVSSADMIFVSLEEAQPPIHTCCRNQTQTTHGFVAGNIVYYNGTSWALAVAENGGAMMVLAVLDVNTFVVGFEGCIEGLAGLVKGSSYVVVPQSQVTALAADAGTLVLAGGLITGDVCHPVGVAADTGCLIFNMSPSSCVVVGGGGGSPDPDPDPEPVAFFDETFEGGALVEAWNDGGYFNGSNAPHFATPGVNSSDCFISTYPIGFVEGIASQLYYTIAPAMDHIRMRADFGISAGAENWSATIIDLRDVESPTGPRLEVRVENATQFRLYASDLDGATGVLADYSSLVRDKWYRVDMEISLGTPSGSDGFINLTIDELQGSLAAGSDGTVAVAGVVSEALTGLNLRNAAKDFTYLMAADYAQASGAIAAEVRIYRDNIQLIDPSV